MQLKTEQDLEEQRNSCEKTAHISKRGTAFMEAASLLTIWSILVINEGAIRFINSNPSVDLFAAGRPPKFFLFLGGLVEVGFGLLGLFVGVSAFILKWHRTFVTKVAMVIQTGLGYYVFLIFVFLVPALRAADIQEPTLEGLTVGQSKFIVVLGILTSFHFCLALQGGQFVFMARLICAATGQDFLKQRTGAKMRSVFWNSNMGLAGLWSLMTGITVSMNVGSGRLSAPFMSPPNVGVLPVFTIITGFLMMAWAGIGIFATFQASPVSPVYFVGSGVVYLVAFLNYAIVQFGLLNGAPSGAVAMHAGLVFMVTFLGPYFVHLSEREKLDVVY